MKVYILGHSKDDKGAQLEQLTRKILESQNFTDITPNMQVSGASELDVSANKCEIVGARQVNTPVLCECKAHSRPINMDDWLKFIGKLYIERRKRNQNSTIGLMISLNGANGTVKGSYKDDFCEDSTVQLITNDDLYQILAKLYNLPDLKAVKSELFTAYQIESNDIDLAYYNHKCYLVIALEKGHFTICDSKGNIQKHNDVKNLLSMFTEWTDYDEISYVDIWQQAETIANLKCIEHYIISELFSDSNSSLSYFAERIVSSNDSKPIPLCQIKEAIDQSPYMEMASNNETIKLKDIGNVIDFINYLYIIGLTPELFKSERFQKLLNNDLLEKIKLIQYGLDFDKKENEDCLFLISHSPSALLYAINCDRFLHSYEYVSHCNPKMKSLLHNHFFRQLIQFFEQDFSNQKFHDMMRTSFEISELHMISEIKTKTGEEEHSLKFEQNLSLIPLEGYKHPVLLSNILK